jgi:hypothetical protein
MLRLLIAIYVLPALSCSVAASQPSSAADRESQLVGTFLSNDFDFSQSLKIRTPKHTFTEYRYQVLDYSKPPAVALTLRGTWALKGRRYCETITQSSYPAWQSLVGRTQCHDVCAHS